MLSNEQRVLTNFLNHSPKKKSKIKKAIQDLRTQIISETFHRYINWKRKYDIHTVK